MYTHSDYNREHQHSKLLSHLIQTAQI